MQQSPSWRGNSFSASQQISRILWNPRVHFRFHNKILPVPVLNQINIVRAPPFSYKMHFNIIISCMLVYYTWSCSFVFLLSKRFIRIFLFSYMLRSPSVWSSSVHKSGDLTERLYTAALLGGLCSNTLGLSSSPRNCYCWWPCVWVCVCVCVCMVCVCVFVVCDLWNW